MATKLVGKSSYGNANFPVDADGRTYHVATKVGECAQRIAVVGDPHRANVLKAMLDSPSEAIEVVSKRGFVTITQAYKGVPVSIVAIGMGAPMMDFFVRECRAVVDGPMAIIRFGSCGAIGSGQIGQIVVASEGSALLTRNVDFFLDNAHAESPSFAYNLSKVHPANPALSAHLVEALEAEVTPARVVKGVNVTADSFYSSQGRIDETFDDSNAGLVDYLRSNIENVQSLEMESFYLLHLARSCKAPGKSIAAAACAMVFADRRANSFIQPETIAEMEKLGGKAVLDALVAHQL
ncbi:nucleoside phosphorylase domain-containing protein [Cladochytrium replicatum]|nr:nucleoside phosphorylase domain-containing protein [Cladochytrium replicatum]